MAVSYPSIRVAPIVISCLLLIVFGVVMIGSASVVEGRRFLNLHLVYLGIAALVSTCVFAAPSRLWHKIYLFGWIGSMAVAIAVLLPGIGHEVNGASRWIRYGPASIQASEVAKFGLCVFLAGYLSRYHARLEFDAKVLFLPVTLIGIVFLLLVAEPDLGSAVVIGTASLGVMFMAGAKVRHLCLIIFLALLLLLLLVWIAPYRMQRLIAFLDPWSVAFGSGYQLTQALIAFGRGGVFGLGLGEGVQKLFYLPEAHNDFIFSVVAEELGAIGVILLALVSSYLVLQLFLLARQNAARKAHFAAVVAYFTGLVLGLQFLVNLGVNAGVLPTKGLTLPFVSYGGNSLVISCALVALTLRASMEKVDASG